MLLRELSKTWPKLILERERGARIPMKEAVAIGVDGGGDAIVLNEVTEEQEVAVRVFFLTKDGSEDVACRVIDGGVQDQPGAPVLQPGMVAPVHLHEEAGLGHAFAAPAMAWRTACPGAADASSPKEPLHRFAGHLDPLAVGEQFGEVVIIHASIERPCELEDAGANRFGESAW